jgi:shikimate kinase
VRGAAAPLVGRGRFPYNAAVQLRRGNLFLVGLPGSGKSTLGRQLARRLDKTFVDADHELERTLGVTIATIFEIEGEASFRDREETALAVMVERTDIVLATGGGVVIRPANRERLKSGGTVVYLHAEPATAWQRTRRSVHRPLLNTPDKLARLEQLYRERDSLYREVADVVVVANDRAALAQLAGVLEPGTQGGAPA